MKHILSEAGGVTTYIEAQPLVDTAHRGWTRVRIYTTAEFSRDPEYKQTKIDLCLEPSDFANLKAVLNSL